MDSITICNGVTPTPAKKWIIEYRNEVKWAGTHWMSWLPLRGTRRMTWITSYVYSDLVGYQTSDIRLLWTITPKPPPPTPTPFLTPPPPVSDFTPPPPCPPPISDLSHCHHTLEV